MGLAPSAAYSVPCGSVRSSVYAAVPLTCRWAESCGTAAPATVVAGRVRVSIGR